MQTENVRSVFSEGWPLSDQRGDPATEDSDRDVLSQLVQDLY